MKMFFGFIERAAALCRPQRVLTTLLGVAWAGGSVGCMHVSHTHHAVPANRLDPALISCPREALAPLPYAALGQPRVVDHLIGPGDTLAIFVYGVFPATEEMTPVQIRTQAVNQLYYPPHGAEIGPTTGLPVRVAADGTVDLPLVGPIQLGGLTINQAVERIRGVYTDSNVIQLGRERITVGLLTPRVKRVVVLREDSPAPNVLITLPNLNKEIHRGSGQVIDLPVYENDVLHALAASGGLPGTDAQREIWVIRNNPSLDYRFINAQQLNLMIQPSMAGSYAPEVIRLPLVGCPDAPVPFRTEDVILEDGDVVFVPRRNEYFIAGGLLPGGRVPLPRDEDIDVLEAIAMANGSVGGPLGLSGAALIGGRVGNLREPTRVLILRKLPDGRQIPIRVDLDRAMSDEKERIIIQNEDVVMLQFKPASAAIYGALNWVNFTAIVPSP
jgi:protein involved in polysaccharide export with SLBB domain